MHNKTINQILGNLFAMFGTIPEYVQEDQAYQSAKNTPLRERTVSVSEVGEVAKGVTLTTAQNTLGVVTNPNEEPVINNDGQSHNDE